MWASDTPPAWGVHVDGARALIKLRGISDSRSSLSRGLFRFVRKSVVRLYYILYPNVLASNQFRFLEDIEPYAALSAC